MTAATPLPSAPAGDCDMRSDPADDTSLSRLGDNDMEDNSESKNDDDTDTVASMNGSFGRRPSVPLSHQEERALLQLQEALDGLVSNAKGTSISRSPSKGGVELEDCSAYLMACDMCPELLTPAFRITFLRHSSMDPWAAAKRMVAYWAERRFLFGDAAFKPLTISILPDLFHEASMVLLPHRDKEGRSVVFFDRLKLNHEQLRDHMGRARCLFYLLDLAAQQNPTASTKGIVILALACKPQQHTSVQKSRDVSWWDSFFQAFSNLYEWKFPQHCMRIGAHALPINVAMIHFCTLPQSTGVGHFRTAAVNVCWNMISSYYYKVTKVHHGSKVSDEDNEEDPDDDIGGHDTGGGNAVNRLHQASLLRQLRPYGLFKRQLPEAMGGLFTMQNFEHWVQRHSNQETRALATKEELLQRKRQVNLLHSRQKRQRRRQELDELQRQSEMLKFDNDRTKAEIVRLEALLSQANEIVQKIERNQEFATLGMAPALSSMFVGIGAPQTSHVISMNSVAHPGSATELNISGEMQPPSFFSSIPVHIASNASVYDSTQSANNSREDLLSTRLKSSSNGVQTAEELFIHNNNIPSAADLCEGFSDDEHDDDHDFNIQLQNDVDPQPQSIWSSMLGMFRHHTTANAGGTNSTRGVNGGISGKLDTPEHLLSALPEHHTVQHDFHAELHRPYTLTNILPLDSSAWQVTTTTTIAPLPAHEPDSLGDSMPPSGAHQPPRHIRPSQPTLAQTIPSASRSSSSSDEIKPAPTMSFSPMNDDLFLW